MKASKVAGTRGSDAFGHLEKNKVSNKPEDVRTRAGTKNFRRDFGGLTDLVRKVLCDAG